MFIAFLPNAPYVLTDIIHLIRGTSSGDIATWVIALVFIPIHLAAILLGFEAYVISLLNVNFYLKQRHLHKLVLPSELALHALCALGIYLGRFIRLNSWDFVVSPTSVLVNTLNTLTEKRPFAVVVVTFVILTTLYWIMKQITLGLKLRYHYARKGFGPVGLSARIPPLVQIPGFYPGEPNILYNWDRTFGSWLPERCYSRSSRIR